MQLVCQKDLLTLALKIQGNPSLYYFFVLFTIHFIDEPVREHERKAWHPVVWQQPAAPIEEIQIGAVRLICQIGFVFHS